MADALTTAAEAYQLDVTTRAAADKEAAEAQAAATIELAKAVEKDGEARAKAEELMVEARNKLAASLIMRDVALEALQQSPAVMRELMAPVANVAHDVKILQVQGLGGEGGDGAQGLPKTILEMGLAAAGMKPFIEDALKTVAKDESVVELTQLAKDTVKGAVQSAVEGARDGLAPENGPSQL